MARYYFGLVLLAVLGVGVVTSDPATKKPNDDDISVGTFTSDWPIGDPRRCQEQAKKSNFHMKRFEVLPGVGWDNLRNLEAGMIVSHNFTMCKATDDGNFLIPDNVFTVPIKSSYVETFAELIDHWHNTSSMTSNSINVGAGLNIGHFGISGSFSDEHQELKSKQIEDKAVTVRVQVRYKRYEAKLQPDPVLSPAFKSRLMSIAANIELNKTEQARYEGQLLVRDFGTHVLTSVTAGAGLVKDDYLKREFVESKSEDKTSILASASASFFNVFHISTSYSHKTDSKVEDMYNKSMTHSLVRTFGGPMFLSQNMTPDQWTAGVDKNLVPMDRSGDPLYFLVTPQTLPELPPATIADVEKIVRQSIELYYEMNTIPGCTKLGSPNFSFSANFDDGSCDKRPTNLTFGGTYQTCSVSGTFLTHDPCKGMSQVNPKTGSFSCPPSYKSIELHQGRKMGVPESRRSCHSCWLFFHCCHTDQYHAEAIYNTFWCAADGHVQQDSGYLFGGLYTSMNENPVTLSKGCPPNFYARRMFGDLSVCMSDDYELGGEFSVPFGGFFSCDAGNPLAVDGVHPVGLKGLNKKPATNSLKAFMEQNGGADSMPKKCPEGYSQHLAYTDMGCSIHYCVMSGALSGPNLPHVKRPPFITKPPTLINEEDNLVMFDVETQMWMRNEKAREFQRTLQLKGYNPTNPKGGQDSNESLSPGAAAGITIGATLACVAIATFFIIIIRKGRARRNGVYRRLTSESNEPINDYGSAPESVVTN